MQVVRDIMAKGEALQSDLLQQPAIQPIDMHRVWSDSPGPATAAEPAGRRARPSTAAHSEVAMGPGLKKAGPFGERPRTASGAGGVLRGRPSASGGAAAAPPSDLLKPVMAVSRFKFQV